MSILLIISLFLFCISEEQASVQENVLDKDKGIILVSPDSLKYQWKLDSIIDYKLSKNGVKIRDVKAVFHYDVEGNRDTASEIFLRKGGQWFESSKYIRCKNEKNVTFTVKYGHRDEKFKVNTTVLSNVFGLEPERLDCHKIDWSRQCKTIDIISEDGIKVTKSQYWKTKESNEWFLHTMNVDSMNRYGDYIPIAYFSTYELGGGGFTRLHYKDSFLVKKISGGVSGEVNSDFKISKVEEYKYDEQNNLLEKITSFFNDKEQELVVSYNSTNTYTEGNMLLQRNNYERFEGELICNYRTEYEYDSNRRISLEKVSTDRYSWKKLFLDDEITYKYNSNGDLVEKFAFSHNPGVIQNRMWKYERDKKRRVLLETFETRNSSNESWRMLGQTIYKYEPFSNHYTFKQEINAKGQVSSSVAKQINEDGNVFKIEGFHFNGSKRKTMVEYTEDIKSNSVLLPEGILLEFDKSQPNERPTVAMSRVERFVNRSDSEWSILASKQYFYSKL